MGATVVTGAAVVGATVGATVVGAAVGDTEGPQGIAKSVGQLGSS